ncbi:MAG: AAA domain-containing protein [Nannocystales bacterium]
MSVRAVLVDLDADRVRFGLEREIAEALAATIVDYEAHRRAIVPSDPQRVRQRLLAEGRRIPLSMAPAAHQRIEEVKQTFALAASHELLRADAHENLALHRVAEPMMLEVSERLLALLDDGAARALFGHELGHCLAHGPQDTGGDALCVAVTMGRRGLLDPQTVALTQRGVLAREITADRFGLLACQDLHAALRLEMIAATGLRGETLGDDTGAYLEQCKEHVRTQTEVPASSLRVWALWHFSQSDRFHSATGGTGGRPLEEIDAEISAKLSAVSGGGSLRIEDERAELPAFVFECALACGVLVAGADGEVSDEELAALEDAFGSHVADWSASLEPEAAHAQFYETAGLVRAGGEDLVRRLFLLVSHVIGADDVVDPRELRMVLALGEALGAGEAFRTWLGPVAAAKGVELDAAEELPTSIPLPARMAEVRDALGALADAVHRTGSTAISPRRLLRLMGAEEDDHHALQGVAGFLEQREVEVVPPLSSVSLDARVSLRSRTRVASVEAEDPALPADRQALLAALARLRDTLISGDGRSPSVRLRSVTRSRRVFDLFRLEAVRKGTPERALALVQAGKTAVLVTPEDAGRQEAAGACADELRQLDRLARDAREETGANDLCIGYPVLLGRVEVAENPGESYGVRGPLVLRPVRLERDGRGARGFSLEPREDQEAVANGALLRLLFDKAGLALPDDLARELDGLAGDVPALIDRLRAVGVSIGVEGTTLGAFRDRDDVLDGDDALLIVEECAVLGLFPQSSSELLHDYDALLRELEEGARPLAEVLSAGFGLLPAGLRSDASPAIPEHVPGWPVLPSDPSQRAVASACAKNLVTVVDGPPGTGKSQLIVNMVADALRRGARVAVVAEKRAALDVVQQRLAGVGVDDAVALVHDVGDDRKALFTKISARLKDFKPRKHNRTRADVLQADHERARTTLETRRSTLAHVDPQVGLCVGELLALLAGGDPPMKAPSLVDLPREGLTRLLELVERLHPYGELWDPAGWWRCQGERSSLADLGDEDLAVLQRVTADSVARAETSRPLREQHPVPVATLHMAADGIAAVRTLLELAEQAEALVCAVWSGASLDVEAVTSAWSAESTALATHGTPLALPTDAFTRNVAVLRSFAGRLVRFFSPLWWRTRGEVRDALPKVWPERAADGFSANFLGELQQRIDAATAWEALRDAFEGLGRPELTPKDAAAAQTSVETLRASAEAVTVVRIHAEALGVLGLAPPSNAAQLAALRIMLEHREAQRRADDEVRAALAPAVARFAFLGSLELDALPTFATRLRADGHRLREADGWLAQTDIVHADARVWLDALRTSSPDEDARAWREGLSRAWGDAHLRRLEAFLPALGDLGSPAQGQRAEEAIGKLATLESDIADLEVQGINATLDQADLLSIPDAEYRARRTPEQKVKESLLKETSKSRSLMPLRQLVRDFADDGILDVLPCWLVSPETMTVLFPRAPLFDLVIFDEASQCTVESGLPVFLRAKQVVVAGDEKQMPPTSYFKASSSSTEDDDLTEAQAQTRDMFAAESLLSLTRNRCPHAGLKWHYRCREEELIAFSNHAMYEGDLLTIPSTSGPHGESALRWLPVEGGAYDSGVNHVEASRVVELLAELLGRPKPPSVGVVTFNLKQRAAILDQIESRLDDDDTFAGLWQTASTHEELDERPFVKNLESVQGDERDVIVFSLGHAPVHRKRRGGEGELYVPARFGPLGQRGGERRLNVAISRAKAECYVVSSFDPALLRVGNSMHTGPRLFKGYLDYAHALSKRRFEVAERILDGVRGTPRAAAEALAVGSKLDGHLPLASQVMLALESTGLRCALHMGTSDFRIPLAVGKSGEEAYTLAVMTDEGAVGASAFEQFVHRPAVLRLRGWTVLHVDAATWASRRSDVLESICTTLGVPVPG